MVNLTALGIGFLNFIQGNGGKIERGIGELVCSTLVVLCFWSFLKGLLGKENMGFHNPQFACLQLWYLCLYRFVDQAGEYETFVVLKLTG